MIGATPLRSAHVNHTPQSTPLVRSDNIGRGIALSIVAILVFGVQDAITKILVGTYSPFQVAMMRYWGFAAFSLWLATRQAPLRRAFSSQRPLLQVARGALLMGDIWCFAFALKNVPLAELQAITLVYPLLVTLFAIPLLGEKVGVFRLTAVAVGFAGALIIVRPGGLPLGPGVFFALASASFYALYIVFTRRVSRHDSTPTSMVYVATVGLVLSTPVGLFFWQPLALWAWALIGVIMVTTCLAHGLMMYALSMAPASLVQPFNYLMLPWAITLSLIIFGHLIDAISLIGAAIIVGAGLIVLARERMRAGGR